MLTTVVRIRIITTVRLRIHRADTRRMQITFAIGFRTE